MSQLPDSVEAEAKLIVAKGARRGKSLLSRYPNFKLVFSPGIGNNFPVVDSLHERLVSNHSPKEIVLFVQKCMPSVLAQMDLFRRQRTVPTKFTIVFKKTSLGNLFELL